jgi:internalin A
MTEEQNGLAIALERIAHEAEARTGTLDLGGLGLTTLPEDLFIQKHLRRLNLGNGIYGEDGEWSDAGSHIARNDLEKELVRLVELPVLEELSIDDMRLTSLKTLAGLAGLITLDCSGTDVSDLTPLTKLTSLQNLNFANSRVIDLSPLAQITSLQFLCFGLTFVSDLTPLAHLKALQVLNCSWMMFVSDLTPLAQLKSLQKLNCSTTLVSDLTPLEHLKALQELHCSNTKVRDLTPLAHLTSLQELDCFSTLVSDLTPLAKLTSLQKLNLYNTQTIDLKPLLHLTSLQELDCSSTLVSDLTPLAKLTSLQKLNFTDSRVSDLTPLAHLKALQELHCSNTKVRVLTPLAHLTSLQELDCFSTLVSDLTPLAKLTSLQNLNFTDSRVSDLTPLAHLKALQELHCSNTKVRDLTPLAHLISLHKLQFGMTQVSDLTPVTKLTALRDLSFYCTQVSDLTPLAKLLGLEVLRCSHTQVSDLTPLANLMDLELLDCSGCVLTPVPKGFWDKTSLNRLYLRNTKLSGIPSEVHSLGLDSCLDSLRAHLRDLDAGAAAYTDVKLMVLGNGGVGKTQIVRRLRNEEYDSDVSSTHGIVLSSTTLPDVSGSDCVRLHLWDFGGQDIYHGTHALFMRTRAVYLPVWATETENTDTHEHDGIVFRNHPIAYWLAFIRHFGGEGSPTLILQTRCDRPEDDARRLQVPDESMIGFKYCKALLHYSALNDRGRDALNEALRDAIKWLRDDQGTATIGVGRLRVQRRLEALRDIDAKGPPGQRQYRTLTKEHFLQICDEEGGISSPEHLLEYFHNSGLVFYRQGLFHNSVILDQGWALEAVYAVFHREKSYQHLRRLNGRFTRELLELLVWENYSKDEQELFLSLMESCGVCFVHCHLSGASNTEYIAPELLPERADVASELEEKWDPQAPKEESEFEYELLHPGLLSSLVARIGSAAGINGLYWKDGVCVWEKTTRSHALIEQKSLDDWRGVIRVQTQGGQAATLLARLRKMVCDEQARYGIRSREMSCEKPVHQLVVPHHAVETYAPEVLPKLEFTQKPVSGREYCVSYAWGDHAPEGKERERIVDKLCAVAKERNIRILRDKNMLGLGERISRFMERIGRGDRVFVILSDKYLKSANCMFELSEIWRNSRCEEDDFLQRVRVYTLPCAKVFSLTDRVTYAAYWKKQLTEVEALIKVHGFTILGDTGAKEFNLMNRFANDVVDILKTLTDTIQPRSFDELVQYGLDAE